MSTANSSNIAGKAAVAPTDNPPRLHGVLTPPLAPRSALTGWQSTEPLSLTPPPSFQKLAVSNAPLQSNAVTRKRNVRLPPLRKTVRPDPHRVIEDTSATEEVLFLTRGFFSPPRERVLLYKEIPDAVADLRNALLKRSDLVDAAEHNSSPSRLRDGTSLQSKRGCANVSPFFGEPLSPLQTTSATTLGQRSFVEIPQLQSESESHVHLLFHERLDYEDDLVYATFDDNDRTTPQASQRCAGGEAVPPLSGPLTVSYREMISSRARSEHVQNAPFGTPMVRTGCCEDVETGRRQSCFWSPPAGQAKSAFALPETFVRFGSSSDQSEGTTAAQHCRQKIIDDIVEVQRRKAIESALSVGVEQLNAPPKQMFLRCVFRSDVNMKHAHQFRAFCAELVDTCVSKPLIDVVSKQVACVPLPLLTDETPFYNTGSSKGKGQQSTVRRRRSTKLEAILQHGATATVSSTAALPDFDKSYLEQVKKLVTVRVCDDEPDLLQIPRTLYVLVSSPSNTHVSLIERVAHNIQHTINTGQHAILLQCKIVDSPYVTVEEDTLKESPREKDPEEWDELPPEEEGWSIEVMPPQRGKWELWSLELISQQRAGQQRRSDSLDSVLSSSVSPVSQDASRRSSKEKSTATADIMKEQSPFTEMHMLVTQPSTLNNGHHPRGGLSSSRGGSASSSKPLVDLLEVSELGGTAQAGEESGIDTFQVGSRRNRRGKKVPEESSTNPPDEMQHSSPPHGSSGRSFSVIYGSESSPHGSRGQPPATDAASLSTSSANLAPSVTSNASPAELLSASRRHSKVFGAAVKNQRLRRLASISGGGDTVASIMSEVDSGVPVAPLIARVQRSSSVMQADVHQAQSNRPDSGSSTDSLDDILMERSIVDGGGDSTTSAQEPALVVDIFGVQSEYQTRLKWVSANQTIAPESIITGRKPKGKGKAKVSLEEILQQRLDMLMMRYGLEMRPNPGALSEQNITTVRRCAGCIFERPHAFCTQCGYLFCTDCFYFVHRPRNETFMWYAAQHPGRIKSLVTPEFLRLNDFDHTAISVESLFRSAHADTVPNTLGASPNASAIDLPVMASAASNDANSVISRNARKVLEKFRSICADQPTCELATVSGGGLSDDAFRLSIHNVLAQLEERLRVSCAEATPSTEFNKASSTNPKSKKKKSLVKDPTEEHKRLVTGALDAFHPTQLSHLLEVIGRFQLRVPPALYRVVMGCDERDETTMSRIASQLVSKGRRVSSISKLVRDGQESIVVERSPPRSGKDDHRISQRNSEDASAIADDDEAFGGLGERVESNLASVARFEIDSDEEDQKDGDHGIDSKQPQRGIQLATARVEDVPAQSKDAKRNKSVLELKLEKMLAEKPDEPAVALFYEEPDVLPDPKSAKKRPKPSMKVPTLFEAQQLLAPVGPSLEEVQSSLLDEMMKETPEKVSWYRSKVERSRKAAAGNAVVISVERFDEPTVFRLPAASLEASTIVSVMERMGYSVDWMRQDADTPPFLRPTAKHIVEHISLLQKIVIANDEISSRKLVVIVLSRGLIARPSCFSCSHGPLTSSYELVALASDTSFSGIDGTLEADQCIRASAIQAMKDAFQRSPLLVMECWPIRNAAFALDEEGLGFGLIIGRDTVLCRELPVRSTETSLLLDPADALAQQPSDVLSSESSEALAVRSSMVEGEGDGEGGVVGGGERAQRTEEVRVPAIRLAFSYLPQQGGLMVYYFLRALEGRSLFSRVVMSHSVPASIASNSHGDEECAPWVCPHRPPLKINDYEVSAVDLYAFISRRVEAKGVRFLFGDEIASVDDDQSVAATASPLASTVGSSSAQSAAGSPAKNRKKSRAFVAGGTVGSSPSRQQRSTSPSKTRQIPGMMVRRPSTLASVTINRLVAQREAIRKDPLVAISDDCVLPALSFPQAIVSEMMRLSMVSSGNPFAEFKNAETTFNLQDARRFHVTLWARCDVPMLPGGMQRSQSTLDEIASTGGVSAAAATAASLEEDTIFNTRWRRSIINMFQTAINGSRGVTRNGRVIQIVGTRCECSIVLDFGSGWMDDETIWGRIEKYVGSAVSDAERITGKSNVYTLVAAPREGVLQILCVHVDFRAILLQTLASNERRATKGLGFQRPTVWVSIIVSILGTSRDFRRVRKMIALQTTGSNHLVLRHVERDNVAETVHSVAAKIQALFRAGRVRSFLRDMEELIDREERVREMNASQLAAALDEVVVLLRAAQEEEFSALEVASRDQVRALEVDAFVELIDELKDALDVEAALRRQVICNMECQGWLQLFEAPNRWVLLDAEDAKWTLILQLHKLQFRQVWQRYYTIIEEYQERIRLRTDARMYVVMLPKLLRIPGFFSMQQPPCDFDVASSLVMFPPNFKALYQKAKRAADEPQEGD